MNVITTLIKDKQIGGLAWIESKSERPLRRGALRQAQCYNQLALNIPN